MVPMHPQERFFLEIILQAADFTLHARDDVEDPLHDALTATGLGEVTGAGSGSTPSRANACPSTSCRAPGAASRVR
jgi:hypothetical protein